MERFEVNVLGQPPSKAQLDAAEAAVEAQLARWEGMWFYKPLSCVAGFGLFFGAAFLPGNWSIAGCVAALIVGLGLFHYAEYKRDEAMPPQEAGEFGPIGAYHAEQVLDAIEVDPRLDAYRLAVVAQGRELTVLEADAFASWGNSGFARAQTMAAVRGTSPLVMSPAPAASGVVVPISGREQAPERP